MSNDKMIAGRYASWAAARKKHAWMLARLAEGHTVYIATALRVYSLKAKHAEMLRASRSGLYMQSGKSWVCIDFCGLSAR